MIEVVSYPPDLAAWKPTVAPPEDQQEEGERTQQADLNATEFYLELYGEAAPRVDMDYAQVLPAGAGDGTAQTVQAAPIYEYWWTIGHAGQSTHTGHLWDHVFGDTIYDSFWANLRDPAARVYLFFPVDAGWRIKELVATVKYLTPIADQQSLLEKASQNWQKVSPLVADASQMTGALAAPLSVVPGAGAAAAGASTLLAAISKLQVNNVPQVEGFHWSTRKVTFPSTRGVMQGIMWELTKPMFEKLGGRLTGSIALSFIPARLQPLEDSADGQAGSTPEVTPSNEGAAESGQQFAPGRILAHAVVYGKDQHGKDREIWVPGKREFLKLKITPVAQA